MLAGAINIICGAAEYNVEFDPSSRRETLFKLNSPARLGGKSFQIKFEHTLVLA